MSRWFVKVRWGCAPGAVGACSCLRRQWNWGIKVTVVWVYNSRASVFCKCTVPLCRETVASESPRSKFPILLCIGAIVFCSSGKLRSGTAASRYLQGSLLTGVFVFCNRITTVHNRICVNVAVRQDFLQLWRLAFPVTNYIFFRIRFKKVLFALFVCLRSSWELKLPCACALVPCSLFLNCRVKVMSPFYTLAPLVLHLGALRRRIDIRVAIDACLRCQERVSRESFQETVMSKERYVNRNGRGRDVSRKSCQEEDMMSRERDVSTKRCHDEMTEGRDVKIRWQKEEM